MSRVAQSGPLMEEAVAAGRQAGKKLTSAFAGDASPAPTKHRAHGRLAPNWVSGV